jgi:6-phosphogluconolactonase
MQRRQTLTMALCLGLAALHVRAAASSDELVYIGTFKFGPPSQTEGAASPQQGIFGARLNVKTGHLSSLGLSAELKRASWLVSHPSLPVLYTVAQSTGDNPDSDSVVIGFAIDQASGALKEINRVDAHGRDATHMVLDAASQTLLVANHGSGNVSALPLLADGSLEAMKSEQMDFGNGPTPRQKSPTGYSCIASTRWLMR